jgi:hypothetical protein
VFVSTVSILKETERWLKSMNRDVSKEPYNALRVVGLLLYTPWYINIDPTTALTL